jgi:hypothetical protein
MPSDLNRRSIYRSYVNWLSDNDPSLHVFVGENPVAGEYIKCPVSYRSFIRIWDERTSHVGFIPRRTDLCDVCDSYLRKIQHLRKEDESSRLIAEHEMAQWIAHRNLARFERQYYIDMIKEAVDESTRIHISFDYAQKVSYPYSAQQVCFAVNKCY